MSFRFRPLALAVLLVAIATALLVGGCGGGSDANSSTDQTTSTDSAKGGSGGQEPKVAIQTQGSFSPQAIYSEAAPGVVTIRSVFDSGPLAGSGGQGSGFVLNTDGEIVTNAHVVTDAEQTGGTAPDAGGSSQPPPPLKQADQVYVEFPDRNQVSAEVVGFDPNADIALLKIDPDGLDLKPVPLGNSDQLEVGSEVAAIGSPFGQEQSISTGIVSATDRTIDSLTQFAIDGGIQTDASINPGNSGGPLINADGEVVGINQQINTTSGGNEGVGFAVPVNLVKRSVDDLRKDGKVEYAYIGVTSIPLYPQLADKLGIDAPTGALIISTQSGSPAADAGLKGAGDQKIEFQGQPIETGGDAIVAVDGQDLVDENDLSRQIAQRRPGDKIQLEIIRDGKSQTIDVTLEARPDQVN